MLGIYWELTKYRLTSEMLQVWVQTATIKWVSQESESSEFFDFPVHMKVMLTPYGSLLSVK